MLEDSIDHGRGVLQEGVLRLGVELQGEELPHDILAGLLLE